MKTKRIIPALLFVSVLAMPAHAAPSLSGTWFIVAIGPTPTCTITQTGRTLSGICKSDRNQGPITGFVNDHNVQWTWIREFTNIDVATGKLIHTGVLTTFEYTGQWDLKNAITGNSVIKSSVAPKLQPGVPGFGVIAPPGLTRPFNAVRREAK